MHRLLLLLCPLLLLSCSKPLTPRPGEPGYQRPNFLFILSDDQSWEHTSFSGYPVIETPHFDQIAEDGIYFKHAYAPVPSCTASRSAILTGQYPWRLKSGAVLGGLWPAELTTYQLILQRHGYHTGYTGKGWGPGRIDVPGLHPQGPPFYRPPAKNPVTQQTPHPYVSSFNFFLDQREEGQPFSFWLGANEPHRPFGEGDVTRFDGHEGADFIPGFLPDTPFVRSELAAYLTQIEQFDELVGAVIDTLKSRGLYENTIIVISSDNGMPFSRGKTQNYEHGVHVPLAVLWPKVTHGDNHVDDMINLYDLAPTFLEAAEVPLPPEMDGKSLVNIFYSNRSGQVEKDRNHVITATERHSFDARPKHAGYPTRAIRNQDFVYILNLFPDRWPAGDEFKEAEPSLLLNYDTNTLIEPFFTLATAKRPREELYDLRKDPFQLTNLAADPAHQETLANLRTQLENELKRTEDPVFITGKDVFSTYDWASPAAP